MASSKTAPRRGRPASTEGRAERIREITDAARLCFGRKGFHAATTAEISAEAGISVAGLYHFFANKDELILALIEEDLAKDLEAVRAIGEAPNFFEGLLQGAVSLANDAAAQSSTRLKMEIMAEGARRTTAAEVILRAETRSATAFARVIREAQSRGEVDRDLDPENTAEAVLAMADGMFNRASLPIADRDTLLKTAVGLIQRALSPITPSKPRA